MEKVEKPTFNHLKWNWKTSANAERRFKLTPVALRRCEAPCCPLVIGVVVVVGGGVAVVRVVHVTTMINISMICYYILLIN